MDSVQVYSSTGLDTWAQVAQITIAAFTVILAVIAIWGPLIRSLLLPPKLELREHNFKGDFTVGTTRDAKRVRTIYYHLKVVNTNRSPAHKVRVLCWAVSRRKADGVSFQLEPLIVPMQQNWSFIHLQELLPTIGPERYVDIGYLVEGSDQFVISLMATPGNFIGYVGRNETLRFKFVATADNQIKHEPLYIQIAWDGEFSFDKEEMSKHLVISKVDSLGSRKQS